MEGLKASKISLIGDVLLSSAFVSYIGAFDAVLRDQLWRQHWMEDLTGRAIPLTDEFDPLDILTNSAEIATWSNQGLPADRISRENASIVTNCMRWPLLIDPQLQGIKWVTALETERVGDFEETGNKFVTVQLSHKNWLRELKEALQNGWTVMIENVGEEIDSVLEPVLMRQVVKRGSNEFMRLAGEDITYDKQFRLYLQTKLSNPHYRPEIAAQCTILNFLVTETGLEDQLLAKVVYQEEPDLEAHAAKLLADFNQYKIQLRELENQLLENLANAPEDILSDVELIVGLENTKKMSTEIQLAVVKGREMQVTTTKARNQYMPVAAEASMLYFMIIQLAGVNHMYQYSLDSFLVFFNKALRSAKEEEDLELRVEILRRELRFTIYKWIARGLFTKDTNILLSMLTFQLLKNKTVGSENDPSGSVGYREDMLTFLLLGTSANSDAAANTHNHDDENPLDWLPDTAWSSIQSLIEIEEFANFADDLIESAPRFREWFNHVSPETEKLPLDWRELDKTFFHKLLPIRALRPDRMLMALEMLQKQVLPDSNVFLNLDAQLNSYQILEQIYEDSSPTTPIYFVLSPGVDVISDVSKLAITHDMIENETFHNISLGQGMDVVAEQKLLEGHQSGHWIMLNNVHLMPKWLTKLQNMLENFATSEHGSHERFRLFLSSDPATSIPIGILDCAIKLTNEAPSGMKANLKRAFRSFTPTDFEELDTRTRGILFGLCYFHAVMMERKTFGTKGFNMQYPFSSQDLQASAIVMRNYMENAGPKVPWLDLRYLIGEIMYGGHIVNDFDRTLCMCYLEYFLRDELLDEMEMFPYRDEGK